MKNKDFYLICICLFITIVIMAIGYTNVSGKVKLKYATSNGDSWNVSIIGIEEVETLGNAKTVEKPTFNSYSANFNVFLETPKDSIKYKVTVKNNGNISAKLNYFQFIPIVNKNDPILFTSENAIVGEVLNPTEVKEFYINVKYNSNKTVPAQTKTVTAIYEFIQND